METTSFMPRDLVAKCIFILHEFHMKAGYRPCLGCYCRTKKHWRSWQSTKTWYKSQRQRSGGNLKEHNW
jgi:hypothetical protein